MKTSTLCKPIVLLIILVIGILSPLRAQTPEAQFQQGLIKEEGEGSLQEAIDIYIKVASDESVGRPLQATALLHIGLCYEKLGRTEAEKTYRNLIQNFPDQDETVKIARKQLSLLSQYESKIITKPEELNIRKVWEGQEDLLGDLSPDGRYLSFTDWETGDLAIYEIASGKTRRLTNKGTWDDNNEYSEDSRWSPDSRYITYGWCDDTGAYDLRIIGLEDSEPKVIYKPKDANYIVPRDWSPDGKEVLVLLSFEDRTIQSVLISVADGSSRILRTFEFWPNGMGFSSDGKYIVYSSPLDSNISNRDIFCIKRDGSAEHQLITHPADDIVQGWTPDGRKMLFSSDRDGTMGLYTIEVSDGLALGAPTLIKSGLFPYESYGFSPEGSYYYAISKEWNDIYMAELDPQEGNKVNKVSKMTSRYEGNSREPDYSPDGKFLAYISWKNRSGLKSKATWGDLLVVRDLESGNEREFLPNYFGCGYPRWSPDGKSILCVYQNTKNQFGLFLLDVHSGRIETVIEAGTKNVGYGRHEWSPDGESFYYGQLDRANGTSRFLSCEILSGKEMVVFESPSRLYQVFLSWDGTHLAFTDQSKGFGMSVVPVDGGSPKVLFRFSEDSPMIPGSACAVAWSADNKYLYFILRDNSAKEPDWELCRISAEGGEIEKLGLSFPRFIANLGVHPDGRHLTYSTRTAPVSPAVWVMENFLPSD